MEYTEQEIEMLARHLCDVQIGEGLSAEFVRRAERDVRLALSGEGIPRDGSTGRVVRAAARLMREARKQGAAEMQDRAIAALRALPDGTWGDERGEMSPWPDAIAAVKALTVPR
jgi:hypothetical protein